MNRKSKNHLKAYGVGFLGARKEMFEKFGKWLLNYRGGKFLMGLNSG